MPSSRIEVVIAPESFKRIASGAVVGPVWLQVHDANGLRSEFPAAEWSDFPVVVLGWWLTELDRVARGTASQCVCRFMDGPFQFSVTEGSEALLRVDLLDTGALRSQWLTPAKTFVASLRGSAASTLAECSRRGWSDRDEVSLKRALEDLKLSWV